MDVVVAGGHGQIGQRMLGRLAIRGGRARGLIRNPDHAPDLRALGAQPLLCDLEQADAAEIGAAIAGADAVVFAAGAGPGSGAARKRTVDEGAAIKLIDAARAQGIDRYLMVSAMSADRADQADGVFRAYLEAKAAADAALRDSGLAYTIVRPGRLTDDPGTGRIDAAPQLARSGDISRDDVAATLVALLDDPATAGLTFDELAGEVPIAEALMALRR